MSAQIVATYENNHDQKHVQYIIIVKLTYKLEIRQFEVHSPCQTNMLTTVLTFWVSGCDLTQLLLD